MKWASHLRRLREDRKGASVMELALAAPVLLVMLLGIVDVAQSHAAQVSLQQAAARALENLQAGGDRQDYAYVQSEGAAAAGVPLSQVTVTNWLECDGQRQTSYTGSCQSNQTRARYVQIEIRATHTPYFRYSPMGQRNADGTIPLLARASVRIQ
jgi:Flp pilus assembly protein TadG